MIATTHGESILAAIIAEPESDALRLIYADWLDDNGQPGRAEYIRQELDPLHPPVDRTRLAEETAPQLGLSGAANAALVDDSTSDRYTMVGGGFLAEVTITEGDWLLHGPEIASRHPLRRVTLVGISPIELEGGEWSFVTTTASAWQALTHPETQVDMAGVVATELCPAERYSTAEEALVALSTRAIQWAREQ